MRVALLMVPVVVGCASCFVGLSDLLPFPCADDGTCPEGEDLRCVPGVGCADLATAAAELPYPCGLNASCVYASELQLECVPDVGCVTEGDAALALPYACNDDGSCAFMSALDLECIEGVGCADVTIAAAEMPYPCNGDGSCDFSYELSVQCVPALGCATLPLALEVSPYPCNEWNGCAFGVEAELGCVPGVGCVDVDAARDAAPFGCEEDACPSFGAVEFVCFVDVGCLEPNTCDPVSQTGCSSAAPKCTVAQIEASQAFATRCVVAGATVDEATCARPTEAVGVDDCAAGLFCTGVGAPTGERRCRDYCAASSACEIDESCVNNFDTYALGLCAPACDVMQPGECGPDQSCKRTLYNLEGGVTGVCQGDGAGAFGAECAVNEDCASLLSCRFGACTPPCNVDVACPTGATCPSTTELLDTCECELFGTFCPTGLTCIVFGDDDGGYSRGCESVGAGAAGDPCDNGCQSGLCFGGGGSPYTCTDLCDDTHPCANLAACAYRPGQTFGVCPN